MMKSAQVQRFEFLRMPAVIRSEKMLDVLEQTRRIARSDVAVLITGEAGAGKEVVARALHHFSLRSSKAWVDVNCGALPESWIDSELFGHEQGAFSGAGRARSGLFEMADKGTLYFDEVGELDSRMQVRLLRVLDGAAFQRVGGLRNVHVDVRLVAATNRDLERAVSERSFRSDVFRKISTVSIHVPPLRERRADIVPLARFFLTQQKLDVELSPATEEFLEAHDWPGNVRQLRNAVVRTALLHDVEVIEPEHVSLTNSSLRCIPEAAPDLVSAVLEDLERKAVIETLEYTKRNQARAASLLGISRQTLLRRLDDCDVKDGTSLVAP